MVGYIMSASEQKRVILDDWKTWYIVLTGPKVGSLLPKKFIDDLQKVNQPAFNYWKDNCPADGRALRIALYSELYGLIGNAYGNGPDGYFLIPNLNEHES